MPFKYIIKGTTLDMADMCQVNQFYRAACVAEHLLDTESLMTKEDSIDFAYKIIREMDKYGYIEEDAIDIVLKDWRKERWIPVAEELAWKIREILLKHEAWIDTHIYFNGKCLSTDDGNHNYGYNDPSKVYLLEDQNPRDYFEYVGDILSVSFEGPLYDAINYGFDSSLENELDELFSSHNLYKELGNAWNFSLYEV